MIFSQYTETCEVLLDYPEIGGDDIEYYSKKSVRNLLHSNIYVHSRILIAEFPMDGIKCIEKLQSHWELRNKSSAMHINICMQQIPNEIFEESSISSPPIFVSYIITSQVSVYCENIISSDSTNMKK